MSAHMFGEYIQSAITLIIALSIIGKKAIPALREEIKERRSALIKSKLQLQTDLKEARVEYERVNYAYLDSFERKVRWMDDAEQIFQVRLQEARNKHKMLIETMHVQYAQSMRQVNEANSKNYLHDLVSVVSDSMNCDNVNYAKIVDRIKL